MPSLARPRLGSADRRRRGDPRLQLRRPVTVDRLRGRMHLFHLATVTELMPGTPEQAYRTLRGVAEGKGGELEWAEVLERDDARIVADWVTQLQLPLGLSIRFATRESVELDPPLTIHYRHRSGPSAGVAETITLRPLGPSATRIVYRAAYPSPWRTWGRLFTFLGKPVAHIFMRAHFRELRRTLEQKARRGASAPAVDGGGPRRGPASPS